MGDKQKQIEEMAQAMSDFVLEDSTKCDIELSRHLIAKGYRKQSDTVREFAEKLKEVIHERDYVGGYAEIGLCEEIDEIAAQYGVEVEE